MIIKYSERELGSPTPKNKNLLGSVDSNFLIEFQNSKHKI